MFVQLIDDRMRAYQAPVVEVMPLGSEDSQALTYPSEPRDIDARKFKKWLSQIYPPGVMERTNPRTKKVYAIQSTEGTLRFSPAGSDKKQRYAILEGDIRLTDEGTDEFSYQGKLQVVVSYRAGDTRPESFCGIFDGTYPRTDRRRDRTRTLPLRAAIESLPRQ